MLSFSKLPITKHNTGPALVYTSLFSNKHWKNPGTLPRSNNYHFCHIQVRWRSSWWSTTISNHLDKWQHLPPLTMNSILSACNSCECYEFDKIRVYHIIIFVYVYMLKTLKNTLQKLFIFIRLLRLFTTNNTRALDTCNSWGFVCPIDCTKGCNKEGFVLTNCLICWNCGCCRRNSRGSCWLSVPPASTCQPHVTTNG